MFMASDLVAIEQALNQWLDETGIEGIRKLPVFFSASNNDEGFSTALCISWTIENWPGWNFRKNSDLWKDEPLEHKGELK